MSRNDNTIAPRTDESIGFSDRPPAAPRRQLALRRRCMRLGLIADLARAANDSVDFSATLIRAMAMIADALGWERGEAYRIEGGHAALLAEYGALPDDARGRFSLPITLGDTASLENPGEPCRGRAVARLDFAFSDVLAPGHTTIRALRTGAAALAQAAARASATIPPAERVDLPGNAIFAALLENALARAAREPGNALAVLFIEIDTLGLVAASLGAAAATELFDTIAARLRKALRQADGLARAGEPTSFTALLAPLRGPRDALIVARRIHEALDPPFSVLGQTIAASASIGIATTPQARGARLPAPAALIADAQRAMRRARAIGGGGSEFADSQERRRAQRQIRLAAAMADGLNRGEFALYLQPIRSLVSGTVISHEALLRWQYRNKLLNPALFLPLAEADGVILAIGDFVLFEACRLLRRWDDAQRRARELEASSSSFSSAAMPPHASSSGSSSGRPRRPSAATPPGISVNISARQFHEPDFVERVAAAVGETGIAPHRLQLEIAEAAAMGDEASVARILAALKRLGVRTAIDAFGTGLSSLPRLAHLPIDTLKIDRSLIAAMEHEETPIKIVRSIVGFGRIMGFETIAVGIETQGQEAMLQAFGCSAIQGFRPGAPRPAEMVFQ